MRILVTGAYGLIGSACLARLHRDGHELVGAGRSIAGAERRFPFARWVKADFKQLASVEAWRPLLAGIDAVVNCVGVLQDAAGDDTRRVHVAGTCPLFDACAALGIRRVVHVSAIGAAIAGRTAFARTKAEADAHLTALDLDWVILRPGIVISSAVYGGSAMLRGLAGLPGVTPVIGAQSRLQIVGIDDLAETVARCVASSAPARVQWTVAHPQVLTLGEVVTAVRAWLGFAPRRLVEVPRFVGAAVAAFADAIGWLGWRSPARSTSLAHLAAGVVGDPAAWMAATGIKPLNLAAALAARPSSVQDRWFARLYVLKPVAIAGLAAHWIYTGVDALLPFWKSSLPQLARGSLGNFLWLELVIVQAVLAVVLGTLLLVRKTARFALLALLVVMLVNATIQPIAAMMFAGRFLASDIVAVLLNLVPRALAALFVLAILDDR